MFFPSEKTEKHNDREVIVLLFYMVLQICCLERKSLFNQSDCKSDY